MAEPYKHVYKHIDPNNLPESDRPPHPGTHAECLRDGLLDVVHIAVEAGMSWNDVDEAVAAVVHHVSKLRRERLVVLLGKKRGGKAAK